MKKYFAATIKYLTKAETLWIQPSNANRVDLCDGHIAVRVPRYYYETEFMTSSPRFRAVETGKFYAVVNDRKGIPEEKPTGVDMDGVGLGKFQDKAEPAIDTCLMREWYGGICRKGNSYGRYYVTKDGSDYVFIQMAYHDILNEFAKGRQIYMTNRKSPLFYVDQERDDWAALVLPINENISEFPWKVMAAFVK